MSSEDKELLKNAIPDLISDSSTKIVAENKIKKILPKADEIVKSGLVKLLEVQLSESFKRLMGY